jgi:ferredoxin
MAPLRLVVGKKQKDSNQTLDFDEVRMPRLLSVNVGLPRDVTWNGKTVRTITPGMAPVDHTPHLPPGPPGSGPPVSFARSGITAAWDQKFASLLELAEACDVPVRWSCRTGVCHPCMTGLTDGSITYNPEPLERPAPGNVLVCCSQPNAGVTLDL